jgi:2-desacetyl-2-hydroxyethyl bacteriochlorophyllide A dehydrogenase
MPGTVSRLVFPEPLRAELEQIDLNLDDLGPHEIVVRAKRSVISPGTELAHYRGDNRSGPLRHTVRPGQPFFPGYAMVGTVMARGNEVAFLEGTDVLSHTPHQTVARFDCRERVCVPLPAGLGVDVAPFARLAQVGGVSLQLADARPGDTVAVIGLGPVGNLVAQLAQASGYRVIAVERSAARRSVAHATGLKSVVSPEEAGDAYLPAEARLVLECSGSASAVVLATEICSRHGQVMMVGAPWRAEPEVAATLITGRLFERFVSLRSGWEWQVPLYGDRSVAACTAWVLDRLADGAIDTAPLTSGTVPPEAAASAYQMLAGDPEHHMTFLLDWERA